MIRCVARFVSGRNVMVRVSVVVLCMGLILVHPCPYNVRKMQLVGNEGVARSCGNALRGAKAVSKTLPVGAGRLKK